MAHFDFLIDKGNKPKKEMEYIYRLDTVWVLKGLDSTPVKKGIIVTDVIQNESGIYEFTIKKTGVRCSSTYGWAFAENTKENVRRIKVYEKEDKKLEALEEVCQKLRNNIITLKPKKEKKNRLSSDEAKEILEDAMKKDFPSAQKIKPSKIKVDKRLNKYTKVEMFPDKMNAMKETLKKHGFPKFKT